MGADSCVGVCGEVSSAGCYCDEACVEYGDCCPDVCDACPELDHCGGVCEPDCTGKVCGGDGCDGSCGECSDDKTCAMGSCVPVTDECTGCADWQICVDGACINPESAGDCEYGGQYIAGGCFGIDWIGCCDGVVLYYCDDQSDACPIGDTCLVVLDCGASEGVCSWGAEAGFFMCMEASTIPEPDPEGNLYCNFG